MEWKRDDEGEERERERKGWSVENREIKEKAMVSEWFSRFHILIDYFKLKQISILKIFSD